ncbi:hypothetical protein POL68_27840 [Stigmatella sp. ncwal1]|uniref:Lipoprotein n=1 Tax=Stigmatella ashevillensis TaxID=2995309 RepID=A0ABT5DIX8_9BACT|nr:hypothetical protein [Stigmatella ashevillena]MDC0712306.1 hypothetical protein [Stigmatella ashevillena]
MRHTLARHTVLSAVLTLTLLAGCDTGEERRTFPVEVTARPMTGANEYGWTVTLESVHASMGPVRFFEGRVLLSNWRRGFDWYSLVGGTASAHPGHYLPGDALAEVLSTGTVDLLATAPTGLGDANAVTGDYGSLELTLPVATGTSDAQGLLNGHAVRVRGEASHTDGRKVRFDGQADLPKPIEGIRFERELGKEAGRARITVELAKWLGRIDFGTVGPSDTGTVQTFPAASQAQNALVRGVEDTSAYVVTWVEGGAQ